MSFTGLHRATVQHEGEWHEVKDIFLGFLTVALHVEVQLVLGRQGFVVLNVVDYLFVPKLAQVGEVDALRRRFPLEVI